MRWSVFRLGLASIDRFAVAPAVRILELAQAQYESIFNV